MNASPGEPLPRLRASTLAFVLLTGAVLGATTLWYGWTGSTTIFSYIAQRILEGGVAYKDGWDIKGPGIYYFFALAHLLFGKSALAFRLFDVLWHLGTAVAVAWIAQRLYGRQAAALFAGIAYAVVYFSQNFWNFAISDGSLILPLAVGFLFLLRAMEADRARDWFGAAFCVGIAALFKLPFGLMGVPMLVAAFAGSRGAGTVARRWTWLAAGITACFALSALYFWSQGALGDFYTAYILAALSHSERHREYLGLPCLWENASKPVRFPIYVLTLAGTLGMFLPAGRKARPETRRAEWLLLAWIGISVVILFLHGSYADYHFLPPVAPIVILAGGLFARCLDPQSPRWVKAAVWSAVLVLAVIPAEKFRQHALFTYHAWTQPAPPHYLSGLTERIRRETAPNDRIFVWGEVAGVYLDAERRSASRFPTTFHLGTPMHWIDFRGLLLRELRATPPRLFVVIKSKKPDNPCAESLVDMYAAYFQFTELKNFVDANYRVEEDAPEYTLYTRVAP